MSDTHKQIFVGGTGRSGTTICQDRLAAHEEILAFGRELRFIIDYLGLINVVDALTHNFSISQSREAVFHFERLMKESFVDPYSTPYIGFDFPSIFGETEYFREVDRFLDAITDSTFTGSDVQVDAGFFSTRFPNLTRSMESRLRRLARLWPRLTESGDRLHPYREMRVVKHFEDRSELAALAGDFVDRLFLSAAHRNGKTHWCEKTPYNALHLEFIFELWPECYFVHMVRDPRAVASSYRNQPWAPSDLQAVCSTLNSTYRRFFRQREMMDLTRYRYLELRLEDLVAPEEQGMQTLCEFLGVSDRFTNPPRLKPERVGRWKSTLSQSDLALVERELGETIERLGYGVSG